MHYKIEGGNAFPALRIHLAAGESVKAESNAMIAMPTTLSLKGKMDGGLLGALGRKLLTGESFFLQEIAADKKQDGWVLLGPSAPGEIVPVTLSQGKDLIVQKNSYLASETTVKTSTKVQSLTKGLFSGEGLFIIKMSGQGQGFLSAFGSVKLLELGKDEEILIDNGHLVAWDADMSYTITKGAKTWVSAATSGEGLACKFKGPGRVYIQTRNPKAFGVWTTDYIVFPKNN